MTSRTGISLNGSNLGMVETVRLTWTVVLMQPPVPQPVSVGRLVPPKKLVRPSRLKRLLTVPRKNS